MFDSEIKQKKKNHSAIKFTISVQPGYAEFILLYESSDLFVARCFFYHLLQPGRWGRRVWGREGWVGVECGGGGEGKGASIHTPLSQYIRNTGTHIVHNRSSKYL